MNPNVDPDVDPNASTEERPWPPVPRTVITLAVTVGLALGIRSMRELAAPILMGLVVDILPQLQDQLSALQEDSINLLARWGIDASRMMQDQVLSPENLVAGATVILNALYNALKGVALIVVIAAFPLVEAPGFRGRLYAALGEDRPAMRRWIWRARDTRSCLLITTVR